MTNDYWNTDIPGGGKLFTDPIIDGNDGRSFPSSFEFAKQSSSALQITINTLFDTKVDPSRLTLTTWVQDGSSTPASPWSVSVPDAEGKLTVTLDPAVAPQPEPVTINSKWSDSLNYSVTSSTLESLSDLNKVITVKLYDCSRDLQFVNIPSASALLSGFGTDASSSANIINGEYHYYTTTGIRQLVMPPLERKQNGVDYSWEHVCGDLKYGISASVSVTSENASVDYSGVFTIDNATRRLSIDTDSITLTSTSTVTFTASDDYFTETIGDVVFQFTGCAVSDIGTGTDPGWNKRLKPTDPNPEF